MFWPEGKHNPDCADSFDDLLWKYLHTIRQSYFKIIEPALKKAGLTKLQLLVLHQIETNHSITISELTERSDVGQGNISTMCNKLEKDGFIVRKKNELDRRISHLHLTNTAKDVIKQVTEDVRKVNKLVLNLLPDEKKADIISSFDALAQAFEKHDKINNKGNV